MQIAFSPRAFIINQHLERTISALEWKQVIEYGKAKIKSYYTKMQEKHIINLEKVLDKARISHEHLRRRLRTSSYIKNLTITVLLLRVEDVELESIKLRESVFGVGPVGLEHQHHKSQASKSGSRVRILRSVKHENRRTVKLANALNCNALCTNFLE